MDKHKQRLSEGLAVRKSYFPKSFFWGASTASHQIEGNTHNQWSEWEKANAKKLARQAHKHFSWLPNWHEIRDQVQDPNNYISGKGIDHYNRYKEDFDIAKKLNLNAFRFGIEWSRMEPQEGVWDEAAVEHYRVYISELKKRGLEPFLNVWHWTVPVWFDEKGGFTKKGNLRLFDRFVEKVAQEYVQDLKYIITINEPNVYTFYGYVSGRWPPGKKNPYKAVRVYFNLIAAHKRAYKILKSHKKSLQIGIAPQLGNIQAKRPHKWFDEFVTQLMRNGWNWWFYNRTRNQQDFIGFNYYFTDYFKGPKRINPKVPVGDLGWYMEPEGLYPIMLRIWDRYKKPIIVTENGLADARDEFRQWWLEETMIAMERALSEGVDIRGYFHWSLLDNFEWSDGWWPKFGLVAVDREHGMKRTVRESAKWFAKRLVKLR